MINPVWHVYPKVSADLNIQLLHNRGITTAREQEAFLHPAVPTLDYILSQSKISTKALSKAVGRLNQAIKKSEKVIVYGDYDTDGITGTTILWEA